MSDLESAQAKWTEQMLEYERAQIDYEGWAIGSQIGALSAMNYCDEAIVTAATNEEWYGAAQSLADELIAGLSEEEQKAQRAGITAAVYTVFGKEKPF